jgi:hypothetical protein
MEAPHRDQVNSQSVLWPKKPECTLFGVPTWTTEAAKVDLELRAWTNFKLGSDRAINRTEFTS